MPPKALHRARQAAGAEALPDVPVCEAHRSANVKMISISKKRSGASSSAPNSRAGARRTTEQSWAGGSIACVFAFMHPRIALADERTMTAV